MRTWPFPLLFIEDKCEISPFWGGAFLDIGLAAGETGSPHALP